MIRLAKKYAESFHVNEGDGMLKKLFFGIMATLPHIIASFVLIVIFPEQWFGIIIIGIILPDLYYFTYHAYIKFFPPKEEYAFGMINLSIKTASHILVFVIVLVLFFNKYNILALAGGIHLLTDILGF